MKQLNPLALYHQWMILGIHPQTSVAQSCEKELFSWKSVPCAGFNMDALHWWKMHNSEYPRLAKLAQIYLSFTASSASVERLFSRGPLVQTKKRSRLSPESMEIQMVSSQNQKFLEHLYKKYDSTQLEAVYQEEDTK